MALGGKVLAVIPARGGSVGLPGKNTRSFAGLPLMAHSILMARMCPEIDRCIVSTDSPEIAEVAGRYRADVPFMRPAELAQADTPIWPVLRHALSQVEDQERVAYGYVVLLDPTSPTRLPAYVSDGLGRLEGSPDAHGIISVSLPDFSPIWHCVLELDGRMVDFVPEAARYNRRQAVPPVYRINGLFYIWRAGFVRSQESWRENSNLLVYVTPESRSVSIDDLHQFARAELMVTSGLISLPWLDPR